MSGYAQVTVRRNRDGSVVIITESANMDPEYEKFEAGYLYDAKERAEDLIRLVLK